MRVDPYIPDDLTVGPGVPVFKGELSEMEDAWVTYGECWVQLDATRHVVLHSEESLRIVARRAGVNLASITRDFTGFQFWGSELYRSRHPSRGSRGHTHRPAASFRGTGAPELRDHRRTPQRGDQLVAVLAASAERA